MASNGLPCFTPSSGVASGVVRLLSSCWVGGGMSSLMFSCVQLCSTVLCNVLLAIGSGFRHDICSSAKCSPEENFVTRICLTIYVHLTKTSPWGIIVEHWECCCSICSPYVFIRLAICLSVFLSAESIAPSVRVLDVTTLPTQTGCSNTN